MKSTWSFNCLITHCSPYKLNTRCFTWLNTRCSSHGLYTISAVLPGRLFGVIHVGIESYRTILSILQYADMDIGVVKDMDMNFDTGCSLNIVFFSDFFEKFRTLFSFGVRVCTQTRQVENQRCSRTRRVQKNHNILRKKHNI